ncbi:MAG: S41 family peptidase [bacterium]
MSNRKINTALPILFSIAVILGMFVGYKLHSNMPMTKSFFSSTGSNRLNEVMQLVKKRYVDQVNIDSISDNAISGVLESLDPHSVFIPSSHLMEINENLEGHFEGIGVEFNIFDDTVNVLSVMENGPAEKSGILIGDKILMVNDSSAIGLKSTEKFKSWVKGPGGSPVVLKLLREHKLMPVQVIRGKIPIKSLDASFMMDKKTGYIRLNRFSSNTYSEFIEALEKLKNQGMESLVLDLRDNGGGILEEAIDIIDEFIGENKMIVYTQGINNPRKEYKAKRPGIFETGKLVILINEGSASASEVIAGAIQDHERGQIIGRRSFGKGLVQEQFYLSDGSALRLTTARYYTPLGRSIQKPYSEGIAKYEMELINRIHQQKDTVSDTSKEIKKEVYRTANGKTLYGGGGITPDAEVAIDPLIFDTIINKLYMNNAIGNFAYRYFMQNKKVLASFKNVDEFISNYHLEAVIVQDLIKFASIADIQNHSLSKTSSDFLKTRIKAMLARIRWNESAYYQVLNKQDEYLSKAVNYLNN